MAITFITGMPEPNMDLNDLVMNIDTVKHKNIAETMFASMNEKQKEFFTIIQEAKYFIAFPHYHVFIRISRILSRKCFSLLNKRAPSSSLAGFAGLAVGIAWTSLLGNFASSDFSLPPSLDDANARGTFPGSFNSINHRNSMLLSWLFNLLLHWLGSSAFSSYSSLFAFIKNRALYFKEKQLDGCAQSMRSLDGFVCLVLVHNNSMSLCNTQHKQVV
ncbi:hypothetical protein DdX_17549 [Ditylenchus destructor]|uniref:Uncharacterized protein n=1 Tax=Ditylenchus destructor TaxID=166010 RepID=A0AAD4MMU4_9BILA|nr:hypothetical protein DdX_17549 [Ditylenchus destructor]